MACCSTNEKYGYEDSRFEKDVDEDYHCSIYFNVLKNPRTCKNNDHAFCLNCISEHLRVNSETCPQCNEDLTVATLRRPRFLNNRLSKLKINCNHASRGCLEYIYVEDLESHAGSCGFAPVMCSNENCGMVINKQEREHHETVVCEYRKEECLDSGKLPEAVERFEGRLMELEGKAETNHLEMKRIVGKMEGSLGGVKRDVKDLKENLSTVNKDMNDVKVMMSQILEKLNVLELINKLPSPSDGMLNSRKEDILIAGSAYGKAPNHAEIFSWEKNSWLEISPMNEEHGGASSFIDKDQMFVVGGTNTKTIETLNLNELPLKWKKCATDLPYPCSYHQTVVYQQRVIHIGGYNHSIDTKSDVISELQLTSPSIMKELCRTPE